MAKRILITGAGRRIGAALAKALAADGWFAVIHYNRSADDAERVLVEIEAAGGAGAVIGADLADGDALTELIPRAVEAHGPLSALINNASVFRYDTVTDMTLDQWVAHEAINVRAPAFLAQGFARQLPDGEEGCIVNMIDNKVFALNPDYFSYTVPKVALKGLTEMLAMALAPKVRVCGIAPGLVLVSGKQSQANYEKARKLNPLGRGVEIADIVAGVRFILASPIYNGQVLVLDGGQTLAGHARDVAFLAGDGKPAP